MRNANEGTDFLVIRGLLGLPTTSTLFAILIDQQESDLDPTLTFSAITQTAATATKTIFTLTSASRIIDLGSLQWAETTPTTSRSIAILTRAPGGTTPLVLAYQNLTDGSAWNCPTLGPPIVPGLSVRFGYQGET